MRRLWVVPLSLVALIAMALPAMAEITPADLDDARATIRKVASQLEDRVAAFDAAAIEESQLRDRLDDLVVSLAAREREMVLARRSARDRAAQMYMSAGSDSGTSAIVSAERMGEYPARYAYLASVSETDREVVNRLEAARRDFEQQKVLVDKAIGDQESLRQEMDSLVDSIYSELEAANDRYQQIRGAYDQQEEERRLAEFLATSTTTTTTTTPPPTTVPPTTVPPVTTTSPPTTSASATTTTTVAVSTTSTSDATTTTSGDGGTTPTTVVPTTTTTTTAPPPPPAASRVCPVDGAVVFRDSWGEPRSGGRTHKGTDMMAARWTPIVAIEAGYIYQVSWHSAGGLGIYVKGVSGALWYYAHSQAAADGIKAGVPVVAGQLIGYVGDSGNASVTHVHFGYQPKANWVYANPYPIVNDLCR